MPAGIQGDGRIIFLPHAFDNGGVLLYGRIIATEGESKGKRSKSWRTGRESVGDTSVLRRRGLRQQTLPHSQ
jgi:hypothetical protein